MMRARYTPNWNSEKIEFSTIAVCWIAEWLCVCVCTLDLQIQNLGFGRDTLVYRLKQIPFAGSHG